MKEEHDSKKFSEEGSISEEDVSSSEENWCYVHVPYMGNEVGAASDTFYRIAAAGSTNAPVFFCHRKTLTKI